MVEDSVVAMIAGAGASDANAIALLREVIRRRSQ